MKMVKVKSMINNEDINWFLLKRNKLSFLKSIALALLRTLVLLLFTTPLVN
jgi:hypothetical protein